MCLFQTERFWTTVKIEASRFGKVRHCSIHRLAGCKRIKTLGDIVYFERGRLSKEVYLVHYIVNWLICDEWCFPSDMSRWSIISVCSGTHNAHTKSIVRIIPLPRHVKLSWGQVKFSAATFLQLGDLLIFRNLCSKVKDWDVGRIISYRRQQSVLPFTKHLRALVRSEKQYLFPCDGRRVRDNSRHSWLPGFRYNEDGTTIFWFQCVLARKRETIGDSIDEGSEISSLRGDG